jgi:hypothetical protein
MNSLQPNVFLNATEFAINTKFLHANKPTKQVRFSETSVMILMQPKTIEDFRVTWYTQEDIETFRRDKRNHSLEIIESGGFEVMECLIHGIVKGIPLTVAEDCGLCLGYFCGLETSLVRRVGKSLLSVRAARRSLVLGEQARQRTTNEKNAERLAFISWKTTAFARDWARMTAVINQMTE